MARDVVRQVQEAPQKPLTSTCPTTSASRSIFPITTGSIDAVEEHLIVVAGETLADEVIFRDGPISDGIRATVADGRAFHMGIVRMPERPLPPH